MTPDLTRLRNDDLRVEATDGDAPGTPNSLVRYEIIRGNYENKFEIDDTGRIRVTKPLIDPDKPARTSKSQRLGMKFQHRRPLLSGKRTDEITDDKIEPVITLTVRAYDSGIPSLASEVPVQIFTTEVSAPRAMRFIVSGNRSTIDLIKVADLISTMTGGQAEIQGVKALEGNGADSDRNPKNVPYSTSQLADANSK